MAAPFQVSYDFVNTIRSFDQAFQTVIQQKTIVNSLAKLTGQVATNTKHEWLNDTSAPLDTPLTVAYTAADGFFSIADTSKYKVGDILYVKKADGTSSTVNAVVTNIPSGIRLDIALHGTAPTTVDENLLIASTVMFVARPQNEKTAASADVGFEPSAEFNYTQIFSKTACVSGTALSTGMYGINQDLNGLMAFQLQKHLIDMSYEVERSMISGVRTVRTSGSNGTMGGILEFLALGGNVVNAATATLTATILNDAFEQVASTGGRVDTLLCNPVQHRVISSFVANFRQINASAPGTTGGMTAGAWVDVFVSDQGDQVVIKSSRHMPCDKIAMLTTPLIGLVPMANRTFESSPATEAGFDGEQVRILGEYTMEMKNAGTAHVLLVNLDPTP